MKISHKNWLWFVCLAAPVSATPQDQAVLAALKTRLPKTHVTKVHCLKAGICEVTAGDNVIYVDTRARYLIVGRVYDMVTRQDLTAARLLQLNPGMLAGTGLHSGQGADGGEAETTSPSLTAANTVPRVTQVAYVAPAQRVSLKDLPANGAIIWGPKSLSSNPIPKVTIFTDFHCGYCRALSHTLEDINVEVSDRPISVLGSRDLAERVLCAKDPIKAMRDAYAGVELGQGPKCDTSGLDANERFARAHGFTGTPVLVRADGAVLMGYRSKEVLIDWLKGKSS